MRHRAGPGRLVLMAAAADAVVCALAMPASTSAPLSTDRDPQIYRSLTFDPTPGMEELPMLRGHTDPATATQFGQTVGQADRWGLQQDASAPFAGRFDDLADRLVGQRLTGTTVMGYDVHISGQLRLPGAEANARAMADTLGIRTTVRYVDVPPRREVRRVLDAAGRRFTTLPGVGAPAFDTATAKVVVDDVPGTADAAAVRRLADELLGPAGLCVDLRPVTSVQRTWVPAA